MGKETEEFNWEESPSDIPFFGEKMGVDVTETLKEEETKEEETKENLEEDGTKKVETKDVKEDEFFQETGAVDKTETQATGNLVNHVSYLKEKGLVDFELEEGTELTEELAEEILEDSIESKVKTKLDELFEELPDEVKNLNKFIMKGGSFKEYIDNLVTKTTSLSEDLDMDDEDAQELVMEETLKAEGYTSDLIDTQIEFLKSSGKLKEMASMKFNKWKADYTQSKTALLKNREQQVQAEKEKRKEFKKIVSSVVSEDTNFENIQLSIKDKQELPTYVSENNVKLTDGGTATQMQVDLYKALQDPKKVVILAKFLREDFKMDSVIAKVDQKVTRKIKENLQRVKQDNPTKSGQVTKGKSLAEYF